MYLLLHLLDKKFISVPAHIKESLTMNSALKSFTNSFFIESLHPFTSVMVSCILSFGNDKNCCVGFCKLLVEILLKFHSQLTGLIDESRKQHQWEYNCLKEYN